MNALESFIASKPMGFIAQADLPELIKLDRLCPLLVRIGGGRFTCAAQDLEHLSACVVAGGDYVRDVSFPVDSIERAAKWQPEPVYVDAWTRAARDKAYCRPSDNENDEGGAPDGNQVHPQFNE